MKKFVLLLGLLLISVTLCSCGDDTSDTEKNPPHEHTFVEGVCSCGVEDPNYVAPHKHEFVNGTCECGEKDPNYQEPQSITDEEYKAFFEKVETYVRSFIKSNTRKDLKLKTTYYSTGATISYESSHPEFITNEG